MTESNRKSQNLERTLQVLKRTEVRLSNLEKLHQKSEAKLSVSQNRRLFWGLSVCAVFLAIALNKNSPILMLPLVISLVGFVYFIITTRRQARFTEKLQDFKAFQQRQVKRMLGQAPGVEWEAYQKLSLEKKIPQDLGIFGPNSFWTLIDETLSESGRRRILDYLAAAPEAAQKIVQRQNFVKSMKSYVWFYTRLRIEVKTQELSQSTEQVKEYLKTSFVGPKFNQLLAANLGVWGILVGALILKHGFGFNVPTAVFILFPVVSLSSLSATGNAFLAGTGLLHHLGALFPLFRSLEKLAAKDKNFSKVVPKIYRDLPSKKVKGLEFVLGFVGTQTNPLMHLLLNAFLPWTILSVYFLERNRFKIIDVLPECMNELAEFEVLGCLLMLNKYQTKTYPEFSDSKKIEMERAYHPLIRRDKVVPNDFSFADGKSLGLLTGSNMSGKSTFLRTVGLNQILANLGAPVFADKFVTSPLAVETCIEVSDSLRDGYSYFYAEVRKLRDIIRSTEQGKPTLYLVDEIFRGTNNKERQIGSRAVIETLAKSLNSCGFVSTHDLELTSLESTSHSLVNLHFREEISPEGEMQFHYTLRHGPSPTTNALRIMKAEGINVNFDSEI